jgi:chromosome segregation ATPase
VCELKSTAVRKAEERKNLQVRVNDTIKECTKMKEEEQKCQRQIEEIKRHLTTEKVNKVQLQSNQKRSMLEMQKLRECVKNMMKEKEDLESQYDQLQKQNFKLYEQEVNAKIECAATRDRLETIMSTLAETKGKLEKVEMEKEAVLQEYSKQLSGLEMVKSNVVEGQLCLDEEDIYCNIQSLQGTTPTAVALPLRVKKKKHWYSKTKNVKKDK